MYENAMREIEDMKNGDNNLRKSLDFRMGQHMEDVREIADL